MESCHQLWFENKKIGGKRSTKKPYVELLCTTTCRYMKGERISSITQKKNYYEIVEHKIIIKQRLKGIKILPMPKKYT
jgi:hypothetical protein